MVLSFIRLINLASAVMQIIYPKDAIIIIIITRVPQLTDADTETRVYTTGFWQLKSASRPPTRTAGTTELIVPA
jgi:hypothetical protein